MLPKGSRGPKPGSVWGSVGRRHPRNLVSLPGFQDHPEGAPGPQTRKPGLRWVSDSHWGRSPLPQPSLAQTAVLGGPAFLSAQHPLTRALLQPRWRPQAGALLGAALPQESQASTPHPATQIPGLAPHKAGPGAKAPPSPSRTRGPRTLGRAGLRHEPPWRRPPDGPWAMPSMPALKPGAGAGPRGTIS